MTQPSFFQPEQFLTSKWYLFKNSKLGQLYQSIPREQLADRLPAENRGPGAPRWFSSQRMLSLMFVKAYLNLSDEKLIERFNADWQQLQGVLINHWKRDMNNTHVLLMDATCYESYIRFPTDVKLLWESCRWVFEKQLFNWCKRLSVKSPRMSIFAVMTGNAVKISKGLAAKSPPLKKAA